MAKRRSFNTFPTRNHDCEKQQQNHIQNAQGQKRGVEVVRLIKRPAMRKTQAVVLQEKERMAAMSFPDA